MKTRNRRSKKTVPKKAKSKGCLGENALKTIRFVLTLFLAGIAIILESNDPVVWAFLGTAIGLALGQISTQNNV